MTAVHNAKVERKLGRMTIVSAFLVLALAISASFSHSENGNGEVAAVRNVSVGNSTRSKRVVFVGGKPDVLAAEKIRAIDRKVGGHPPVWESYSVTKELNGRPKDKPLQAYDSPAVVAFNLTLAEGQVPSWRDCLMAALRDLTGMGFKKALEAEPENPTPAEREAILARIGGSDAAFQAVLADNVREFCEATREQPVESILLRRMSAANSWDKPTVDQEDEDAEEVSESESEEDLGADVEEAILPVDVEATRAFTPRYDWWGDYAAKGLTVLRETVNGMAPAQCAVCGEDTVAMQAHAYILHGILPQSFNLQPQEGESVTDAQEELRCLVKGTQKGRLNRMARKQRQAMAIAFDLRKEGVGQIVALKRGPRFAGGPKKVLLVGQGEDEVVLEGVKPAEAKPLPQNWEEQDWTVPLPGPFESDAVLGPIPTGSFWSHLHSPKAE